MARAQAVCEKVVVVAQAHGGYASWMANGQLVGAAPDLAADLLRQAGVKNVEFQSQISFGELWQELTVGDADMTMSLGNSVGRDRLVDFVTPPYASQFLWVITRKKEVFPFNKFEDLLGKVGGGQAGESYGDGPFGQFIANAANLVRSPTLPESLQLLREGKLDYVLAYEYPAYAHMYINNLFDELGILSTFPYLQHLHIAFSKRSKCSVALREKLSKLIVTTNAKQRYFVLLAKYREMFNEQHRFGPRS